MNQDSALFTMPRFRGGVNLNLTDSGIEIDYRDQGCMVDVSEEQRQETWTLMTGLKQGMSMEDLAQAFPSFADQIPDLIRDLDRLGLLEEGHVAKIARVLTGDALFCEIRDFIARVEAKVCTSSLFRFLESGNVSSAVLIGYVTEYFHIVHACPAIVGQALAHRGSPRTYRIMRDYFLSECGHDELLLRSLKAANIDPLAGNGLQPLRATFSIISALSILARQDPLSFKSALFLFERPQPEFHDAFRRRCMMVGLPPDFIDPVLEHSGINEQGAHEDITRLLLHEVESVSQEECLTVKKHLYHLIECLESLEHQILLCGGSLDRAVA